MNSVGIIGGADGPTAILVASQTPLWLWVLGAAVLIAAAVCVIALLFKK